MLSASPQAKKEGKTMTQAQIWKGSPFAIERKPGDTPGTLIFRLSGPFTARDMFGSLTPGALSDMLDFQSTPNEEPPALNILDLTEVPYMDSTGLGKIVTHYVRCRGKGIRLIAVGVSPRVLDLLRLTRMDAIIPMAATVEEAETPEVSHPVQ
jgi:anti-anti-sigma factor